MRIELTKLRAAVLFFSPMVDDAEWSRIDGNLRWLNSALGKARDNDVTMTYTRRKRYRDWARGSTRRIARARKKSHRRLAKRLHTDQYQRLVQRLDRWIRNGA